jgi:hypothetical protein
MVSNPSCSIVVLCSQHRAAGSNPHGKKAGISPILRYWQNGASRAPVFFHNAATAIAPLKRRTIAD